MGGIFRITTSCVIFFFSFFLLILLRLRATVLAVYHAAYILFGFHLQWFQALYRFQFHLMLDENLGQIFLFRQSMYLMKFFSKVFCNSFSISSIPFVISKNSLSLNFSLFLNIEKALSKLSVKLRI